MGAVINGKYYKDEDGKQVDTENATFKQWSHTEQRKAHAKDIIQPYDREGKPNQDFINAFPEESKTRGFLPDDNKLKEL